jgi:three-Cys-motif partner protein
MPDKHTYCAAQSTRTKAIDEFFVDRDSHPTLPDRVFQRRRAVWSLTEMAEPHFGGPWTEDKLSRLRKYLQAYMSIFSTNPRARLLRTIYLDAFAGAGLRKQLAAQVADEDPLFAAISDSDSEALRKGSTQVALETTPPFGEYVFIEHNEEYAKTLQESQRRFPNFANRLKIIQDDANVYLRKWCNEVDWRKTRAVVFLDPYGMQVEWATIEAMAQTESIDLWILFPLGIGVNRLLMRHGPPEGSWASRLTQNIWH